MTPGAEVWRTWLSVAFLVYAMGALWLLTRVVRGWFLARRLRQGRPVEAMAVLASVERHARELGLAHVPAVVEQPLIAVPMTSGILRPVIALPADWRDWPDEAMRAVLAHELTHVARRDALTQALTLVNRAMAWGNPLAWWLHRTLADLAEQASDDSALDAGISQTVYAETLLAFARRLRRPSAGPAWAVAMARQGGAATERRIDRVLAWEPRAAGRHGSTMRVLITVLAAVVVLVTASVRLDATRVAVDFAVTPLQVFRASAPTSGLTAIPLPAGVPATVDHLGTSIERPWRRAPEPLRTSLPSEPALTLPPTRSQWPDDAAARAAREWVFRPAAQPVRISAGFGAGAYRPSPGIINPVLMRSIDPPYTSAAIARKIEGDAQVEVVVLADGRVGDVRIARSLDAVDGLDDAAVRAARQWTFKPATLNGVPVPIVVTLAFQFRLSDAKQIAGVQPQTGAYSPQPLTDDFANGAYWIGTPGLSAPVLTEPVEPKYTAQAMRDRIQGDAVVELIVMPDGSVGKTRMAISLDPVDGLDDNALAAAQQYRFAPGLLNGRPVPVLVTISLTFRLH